VKKEKNKREFKCGDKIRANLHLSKIDDAVVKAVIYSGATIKLQVDFGNDQTALIDPSQIVED
jgi:hypothetical protein